MTVRVTCNTDSVTHSCSNFRVAQFRAVPVSGSPRLKIRNRKGTPKNFATKISPNFRVNFLVRFASRLLFYWVAPSNCSENVLVLFVLFFGPWGSFLAPEKTPCLAWRPGYGGGSDLRKLEGGENFEFPGAPNIDPFYRDSKEKSPIWGVKSPSLRGKTFGASSPLLAFGTF